MNILSGVSTNTAQTTQLQTQQNVVKAYAEQDVKAVNQQLDEGNQIPKNAVRGTLLDIII
jgi:hydrogenase maturation factor HypF (carbamoyltransferase family)